MHLSRRLKCIIVIMRCPSSVRPSSLFFLLFRRLLWNRLTEFNETCQKTRSQRHLPSFCFSGRLEKQDGCPGLKLARHFRLLLWKCWTEFIETWQEVRSQPPLPNLCFVADWKNKMASMASDWLRQFWHLLWNRWTEFSNTWQEAISQRALRSSCSSCGSGKYCQDCLWLAEKSLTSLWNRWTEFNETWEEAGSRRPLSRLCFLGGWDKKTTALASDWLRHFRLLLWNRWTDFNEPWQEIRSHLHLPSLWFSGRWVNKNNRPGRPTKKVAHCAQVHDMWSFGPLVSNLLSI